MIEVNLENEVVNNSMENADFPNDFLVENPNGIISEPVLLRQKNIHSDEVTIRSNGMESNKLYQRNKSANIHTNSLPPLPLTSQNVTPNRGITRMYSVGGASNISTQSTFTQRKSQNGSMVLQIVIPPELHRSNTNQENLNHTNYSNDDFDPDDEYLRNNFVFEKALSTISNSTKKLGSERSTIAHHRPSTEDEKKHKFWVSLSIVISCAYAIFIVVTSGIVFLHDVFENLGIFYEIWTMYLIIVAALYLIYVIIDVRLYLIKKHKYVEALKEDQENGTPFVEFPEGSFDFTMPMPENKILKDPPPHHYCFVKGRHSELVYLKIGATVFCLGHLIHSLVLLVYQFIFIDDDVDFLECGTVLTLILDIIYPCYSLITLYFIFKYANIIINRNMVLARFGLMHCIGSGISFWIWTIIKETVNLLRTKLADEDDNDDDDDESKKYEIIISNTSFLKEKIELMPLLSHNKCDFKIFKTIYSTLSQYIYPFSVEFSILAVGVLVMIFLNVGKCQKPQEVTHQDGNVKECHSYLDESDESNISIHLDCHSSNKGLFFGIILFIASINSIILLFIVLNEEKLIDLTIRINAVTETSILSIMLIACVLSYYKIHKLDVSIHKLSVLDDILLFITFPAFFSHFLFSIYPQIIYGNVLNSVLYIIQLLQVLTQTSLIIDGLRRCSNHRELRKSKPGREIMMFLIIANVAVWINETFTYKGSKDERYEFYGTTKWVITSHIALPLKMFYRFHSSVCLVDIWKYAYEPDTNH